MSKKKCYYNNNLSFFKKKTKIKLKIKMARRRSRKSSSAKSKLVRKVLRALRK